MNVFDYDGKYHDKYYDIAKKGNEDFPMHPAFPMIEKLIGSDAFICEFGCGDGSKLKYFSRITRNIYGFDISKGAIEAAKIILPAATLYDKDMSAEFSEELFDVTLTFYVLEHVADPKKFIDSMIKSTKSGGYAVCLCPNFGSPIFPSPPSVVRSGLRLFDRISLVIRRLLVYKERYRENFYSTVDPIVDREFESDFDTISEISLDKLVSFYGDSVAYASSFWKFRLVYILFFPYLICYILACLKIRPFVNWGPVCFMIIKK